MFPLQKAPSSINHCWTETWLAGRDEMERGGMGMWRKGSEVNRKKKKNWKEKNRGRQKEKGLRAKSKRRSGLFARAWTWRVSIHACISCQCSIISEKNWIGAEVWKADEIGSRISAGSLPADVKPIREEATSPCNCLPGVSDEIWALRLRSSNLM